MKADQKAAAKVLTMVAMWADNLVEWRVSKKDERKAVLTEWRWVDRWGYSPAAVTVA